MPRLGNDKHEFYSRHRARNMNAAKAAIAAGYSAGSSTTHLEENEDIQARIVELRAEYESQKEQQRVAAVEAAKVVGQLAGYGRAWVIQQLAEVAGLAKNAEQFKDATHALELIGKDFGMFQGGSEDEEKNTIPQTMDLDALAAVIDSTHADLPSDGPEKVKNFNHEDAMALIAGQRRADPVPRQSDEETPAMEDDDLDFEALRNALDEDFDRDDEPETPASDDEEEDDL